jgi:hypothetical protein
MKRIAQISFGFSGRFAPGFLPAFHAGPCSTGSYDECPIIILRWPEWPPGEQIWWGFWPLADRPLLGARISEAVPGNVFDCFEPGRRIFGKALQRAQEESS